MTPMIWFGLMPPGGTGNIFIEMMIRRNQHKKFVEPCPLEIISIDGNNYPRTAYSVPYVQNIEQEFKSKLRLIPWHSNINRMRDIAQLHTPYITWFATFHKEVFQQIHTHHKQGIFSVSINYTQSQRNFVMQKWARWQTGLVFTNPVYKKFRQGTNVVEFEQYLLKTGSEQFGYDIPMSLSADADVKINIEDLYNRRSIESLLQSLGSNLSTSDWQFYDTWHQCA